ncbi:MAG: hypothetical protein HY395_03290 [Candidatus Doudnabacteria bacterium]|nr:hypothetical protein [Candidatus Doudnabacteria bacterium]
MLSSDPVWSPERTFIVEVCDSDPDEIIKPPMYGYRLHIGPFSLSDGLELGVFRDQHYTEHEHDTRQRNYPDGLPPGMLPNLLGEKFWVERTQKDFYFENQAFRLYVATPEGVKGRPIQGGSSSQEFCVEVWVNFTAVNRPTTE